MSAIEVYNYFNVKRDVFDYAKSILEKKYEITNIDIVDVKNLGEGLFEISYYSNETKFFGKQEVTENDFDE